MHAFTQSASTKPSLLRRALRVGVVTAWLACLCVGPSVHAQGQSSVPTGRQSSAKGQRLAKGQFGAASRDAASPTQRTTAQGAHAAAGGRAGSLGVRSDSNAVRRQGQAPRSDALGAASRAGALSRNGDARAALDSRTRREPSVTGPSFPKLQRYTIPKGPYSHGQPYEKRSIRANAVGQRSKAVAKRVQVVGVRAGGTTAQRVQTRTRTFHDRTYYPGERVKEPTITITKRTRHSPINRGAFTADVPIPYVTFWHVRAPHRPCEPIRTFEDARRQSEEIGDSLRRARHGDILLGRTKADRPQRVVDHTGVNRRPAPPNVDASPRRTRSEGR